MGRLSVKEKDFVEDGTLTAEEGLVKHASSMWRRAVVLESYNEVWRYKPVSSRVFFSEYYKEPLFPKQQEFCDAVYGTDPMSFRDLSYSTFYAFWGKGGGKDRTVAKLLGYGCYLLCCLNNPQKFLGLGAGAPIDLGNVSINAEQARDVFFEYLKGVIRETKDPETGKSWFATKNFWMDVDGSVRYMDLRDKKDVQKTLIDFGRGIKAHSLNSETHTGEGLSLVFVAFDELGAFKPHKVFGAEGRKGLLGALTSSVLSRSKYGAVFCFSYKYYDGCPMSVVVEEEALKREKSREYSDASKKFVSHHATWEVNLNKTKADLHQDYEEDEDVAMMTYECKSSGKAKKGRLIGNPDIIYMNVNNERISPVISGDYKTDSPDDIDFHSWFVGDKGTGYHLHIDLAKGKVAEGGDAVGVCLAHPQTMKVQLSDIAIEERKERGEIDATYDEATRKGMYVDLLLQIVAPKGKEVSLQGVRRLVFALIDRGFHLSGVSLDGWQSLDTIQELNRKGISAEVFSVDRTTAPYDTLRSLEYQRLVDRYSHPVYEREISEVERSKTGKWDHPMFSPLRERLEGARRGSKDVSDSVAACAAHIVNMPLRKDGDGFYVGIAGKGSGRRRDEPKEEKRERLDRKAAEIRRRFFEDEDERD